MVTGRFFEPLRLAGAAVVVSCLCCMTCRNRGLAAVSERRTQETEVLVGDDVSTDAISMFESPVSGRRSIVGQLVQCIQSISRRVSRADILSLIPNPHAALPRAETQQYH